MKNAKEKFLRELKKNNISETVLDAFAYVDQEVFFPKTVGMNYYEMRPLPIGFGEKSDDPLLLAQMIDALAPKDTWRLLEVGTGSGYSSAILSCMVKELVTVEYNERLALLAKEKLIDNGFFNVRVFAGDAGDITGELGNFDGLIILPACMLRPLKLLSALKFNEFAVFPMGPALQQQLVKYKNTTIGDSDTLRNFTFYRFCDVPPIRGEYGWIDQYEMSEEEPGDSSGE
jgi:protein-L-isoaspartate(D-aspartate) O-methyltransferase